MSNLKMIVSALLFLAVTAGLNAQDGKKKAGQKGFGGSDADLRAEIARLRADLDAALREINNLKIAIAGGKVVPEDGALYRGRPTSSWLEQLKDASPTYRSDAVDAIAALAVKNKKLVPVLFDVLRDETDPSASTKAIKALGKQGPDVLPPLVEIAKDKTLDYPKLARRRAIESIGLLGTNAKPAVPVLAQILRESKDVGTWRVTLVALTKIGPDAAEAIPVLVDNLEFFFPRTRSEEDDRPLFGGGGFGGPNVSVDRLIIRALAKMDPKVRDVLPERIESTVLDGRDGRFPGTAEQDWAKTVEVLKKRYAVKK